VVSSVRFCILLRTVLPVFVVALAAPLDLPAQQFLVCDKPTALHSRDGGSKSAFIRDAHDIFHAFAGDDVTAYFGFKPRLHLVERSTPNAFAIGPDSIVVSSGLLDITDSSSEFAFIIAHELGHLLSERGNHTHALAPTQLGMDERFADELTADAFALRLLSSRGFDTSAGVTVLSKIVAATRSAGGSPDALFPSIEARILAMNRGRKNP